MNSSQPCSQIFGNQIPAFMPVQRGFDHISGIPSLAPIQYLHNGNIIGISGNAFNQSSDRYTHLPSTAKQGMIQIPPGLAISGNVTPQNAGYAYVNPTIANGHEIPVHKFAARNDIGDIEDVSQAVVERHESTVFSPPKNAVHLNCIGYMPSQTVACAQTVPDNSSVGLPLMSTTLLSLPPNGVLPNCVQDDDQAVYAQIIKGNNVDDISLLSQQNESQRRTLRYDNSIPTVCVPADCALTNQALPSMLMPMIPPSPVMPMIAPSPMTILVQPAVPPPVVMPFSSVPSLQSPPLQNYSILQIPSEEKQFVRDHNPAAKCITAANVVLEQLQEQEQEQDRHATGIVINRENSDKTCPECGKILKSSRHVSRHVLHVHHTLPSSMCDVCGKGFRRKSNLRCHMRLHSGEKPIECAICGIRFRWESGLHFHLKTKHSKKMPVNHDGKGYLKCADLESQK